MELRDISRQINRLVHMNTKAKNILHALCATEGTNKHVFEDEKEGTFYGAFKVFDALNIKEQIRSFVLRDTQVITQGYWLSFI